MKVTVLIVEDQVLLADEIEYALQEAGYSVIDKVTTGKDAINVASKKKLDLILMDILLEGDIDGIETAKKILIIQDVPIIYLTDLSSKSVWEKAKETYPSAYLLKPFNERELDIAFQIALRNKSNGSKNLDPEQKLEDQVNGYVIEDRVYFRNGNHFTRVLLNDIKFVKAAGSYSEIHWNNNSITITQNLTQLSAKIQFNKLVRIHRSYLINIDKIELFDGNRAVIGNVKIPIGEVYRTEFQRKFRFL